VAAVEVLGVATELLDDDDDDDTVLSNGDMTWRNGISVSGPTLVVSQRLKKYMEPRTRSRTCISPLLVLF
jgi:hypothetical protein